MISEILQERSVVCTFLRPDSDSMSDSFQIEVYTVSPSGCIHLSSPSYSRFLGKIAFTGFVVGGGTPSPTTAVILSSSGEFVGLNLRTSEISKINIIPYTLKSGLRVASARGRVFVVGFAEVVVDINENLEISTQKISCCTDVAASENLGPVFLVDGKIYCPEISCPPMTGNRVFCVDRKIFIFSHQHLFGFDGVQWTQVALDFFSDNISDIKSMSSSLIIDRALLNLGLRPTHSVTLDRSNDALHICSSSNSSRTQKVKEDELKNYSITSYKNNLIISDQKGHLCKIDASNSQVSEFPIPDFPIPSVGNICVLHDKYLVWAVNAGPVLVTDLMGKFLVLKMLPFASGLLEAAGPEICVAFGAGQPAGRFAAIFENHCQAEIGTWDFQLPCLPVKIAASEGGVRFFFADGKKKYFDISDHGMQEISDQSFEGENEDFANLGLAEIPESVVQWDGKFFAGTRDGRLLVLVGGSRKKRKRDESPRLSAAFGPGLTVEREISVGTKAVRVFVVAEVVVAISDSIVVVRKSGEISRVALGVEIAHAVPIGNFLKILVVTPQATCHIFSVDVDTRVAEYSLQLPFQVISGFRSEIMGNFQHFVLLVNLVEAGSSGLVRAVVDVSRLGAHGLDEALEIQGSLAIEGLTEILGVDENIVVACTKNNRLLAIDSINFQVVATAVLEEQNVKFLRKIGNCSGTFFLVGCLDSVAVVELIRDEMWKFQVLSTLSTHFPIVDAACRKSGNFQVLLVYQHQGCTLWDVDTLGNRKCLGEIEKTLSDVQKIFVLRDSRVLVNYARGRLALVDAFAPDDSAILRVSELPGHLAASVTAFVEAEERCLLATSAGSLVALTK